ncbi:hypothetical protein [Actinoplanes sp. NPDC049118]|uniref:hypothetical protein n=1 Tax=Actinoplanes sp. NPDC049118 TaxID=3155769 RepID=UPI0033D72A2C
MSKKYMFAEDENGTHEVKVDPAHMVRQKRQLEAQGWTVTILDEDERIWNGQIAKQLRDLK